MIRDTGAKQGTRHADLKVRHALRRGEFVTIEYANRMAEYHERKSEMPDAGHGASRRSHANTANTWRSNIAHATNRVAS